MKDVRRGLLSAAVQEIEQSGIGKVSLRAIARRCGVSHQATTHHFDDRAGLFTVLATEGFERLLADSKKATSTSEDSVADAGIAYLAFAEQNPTTFDVMFRPELLHTDDERLVAARANLWLHGLAVIEAAQAEHGWGRGVPADVLNMACWSTVHGLAMIRRDASRTVSSVLPDIDPAGLVRLVTAAIESRPA